MSEIGCDTPSMNKYKNCFLLYMDFLGAKQRINMDSSEEESCLIGLTRVLSVIESKYKRCVRENSAPKETPYVKFFSDNVAVVFTIPSDLNETIKVIKYLIDLAGVFQTIALTSDGWLIRGCLTCGHIYINKNSNVITSTSESANPFRNVDYFIGPALLRADYVEKELAIFPRIIIDTIDIPDIGGKLCDKVSEWYKTPSCVLKGNDGLYYLNYLDVVYHFDENNWNSQLMELDNGINKLKDEMHDLDEKACAKIMWNEEYVNSYRKKRVDDNPTSM